LHAETLYPEIVDKNLKQLRKKSPDAAIPQFDFRSQSKSDRFLLRQGELYLELGQAELCLEASRRALLSDPLLEHAHRQRMRAYAALRDQPGLARQYQQCRKALQKELGIQPTNETERLYEQLIRSF
jgi:DNA-binding SARP family transcriptional activator